MKFLIFKASDRGQPYSLTMDKYKKIENIYHEVEINTIDELINLINNEGEIIMHKKDPYYKMPVIEIYNTHRR